MPGRSFAITYDLVADPPPAWKWEDYESYLVNEWNLLLDSDPGEAKVHRFLEQHPCMIPGGDGGGDSVGGHHGPRPDAVVTEPELTGLRRPRPDFLWISYVSSEVHPVFIEIEDPAKRWFNRSGVQNERLSQAVGQVAGWRSWLDREANRLLFFEKYEVDSFVRRHHAFRPVFCLIYGRRREFGSDPELTHQRAALRPEWLTWMTFDRLQPLAGARWAVTARVTVDGWRVVAVPPTFQLGPYTARTLVKMSGWEAAISSNRLMSEERRSFLLGRLDYWREWASSGSGSSRPSDRE